MNTSGSGAVNAVGYLLALGVSVWAVVPLIGEPPRWLRRPRPAAVVLWSVVAVPSVLEFFVPGIYVALSRQPELIERGQLWRLLTSVTVQDGGMFGTVFNLVVLAMVAAAAMPVWGQLRAVVIFLLGGVGFDLLATFVWPQAGGGNSGATFALATSMVALLAIRRPSRRVWIAAVIAFASGALLTVLGDVHGLAILGGLALGAAGAPSRKTVPASA